MVADVTTSNLPHILRLTLHVLIIINMNLIIAVSTPLYKHDNIGTKSGQDIPSHTNRNTTLSMDFDRYSQLPTMRYEFAMPAAGYCGDELFLVIVVCSAVHNFEERQAIRDTWGYNSNDVRVVFLLGIEAPNQSNTIQHDDVIRESGVFHDIIQVNVYDNYSNLTHKSIAMLQWIQKYCHNVKHVLKTDDDMYIGRDVLLGDLRNTVHKRFIMGHLIAAAAPIRDPSSKWYTPKHIYPESMYPNYMSGTAYVISGDLVSDLVTSSSHRRLLWLEDVYITGICMLALDADHIYNAKFGYKPRIHDPCIYKLIITAHDVTPSQMYEIWDELKLRTDHDCRNTRISKGYS